MGYEGSEYVTNRVGAATSILVDMGFEIESVDRNVIETKVSRTHVGYDYRMVEFQVWYRVFTEPARIKAYCTQRRMYKSPGVEAPWKFDKCTSPVILQEVDETVSTLANRLSIGL